MKIAVYAIAKNERSQVERWLDSTREADHRIVVDTGSSDGTPEALSAGGAIVHHRIVTPWRFDTARNISLALVPEDVDVCLSLDLDETLSPNWRKAIERIWDSKGPMRLRYPNIREMDRRSGVPVRLIYDSKIHSRHGYSWHYGIHEVLWPKSPESETWTEDLRVIHLPCPEKNRAHYLPLLERLIQEEPKESRYFFYYGQSLFSEERYSEAIRAWETYLSLPTRQFASERAMAYRMTAVAMAISKCPEEEVLTALYRAVAESPNERENWAELADVMAMTGNWANAYAAAVNGLRVTNPHASRCVVPRFWAGYLEELRDTCAKNLGILG